jgi:ketosteroid isomerase-like protein
MSDPANVIRDAYACFLRGDVPAFLALMTPDVELQFHGDRAAPDTGRVFDSEAAGAARTTGAAR